MNSLPHAHYASHAGRHRRRRVLGSLLSMLTLCALPGCQLAPPYRPPAVVAPSAYKELSVPGQEGAGDWKLAQPADAFSRGAWWKIFGDAPLDALEEQLNTANQSLAAALSVFQQARAIVWEAQSQYYPSLSAGAGAIRERLSAGAASQSSGGAITGPPSYANLSLYSLSFDASWTPDLWSRVRNAVAGAAASAQASFADLENTRLTLQAELAVDYFALRAQDELIKLLDDTVLAYQKAMDLTRAQYETGIGTEQAVAQAEVQLQTTQAQATNLRIARAQYEHAIAVLVGQAPAGFSLTPEVRRIEAPNIPPGLPSDLLERRPDIAANERHMAQANAQIGVARAAYFPTVTLAASAGLESSSLGTLFHWPNRVWSIGPTLAESLFDAGLRRATVLQYRAAYEQTVAAYRGSVLTAFQQVEDNLSTLRYLSTETAQQAAAVQASQHNLALASDRFQLGLDSYLNVVTAQTALLSNQQAAVTLHAQQLTASVQLIEALGGGWSAINLPTPKDMGSKRAL